MKPKSPTGQQNHDWATTLVARCLAQGVDHFFVAPGSRCTPLTVAISEFSEARVIQHFDERALAFACLGFGRARHTAAAFVCTSGTAVANALPAVVEASLESVPLLLLTADRPPELRGTGANQSIDQQKIFGGYVSWYFDLPCPTESISIRSIAATVDYAIEQSSLGPVHLNCMYREPFGAAADSSKVIEQMLSPNAVVPMELQIDLELGGGDTIVIAGRCRESEALAAKQLATRLGCPFLADVTSGLRGLAYDLQLQIAEQCVPKTVIHLGGRITSKRWWQFVGSHPPQHYVHISSDGARIDPIHRVTQRYVGPIESVCTGLRLKDSSGAAFRESWEVHSSTAIKVADRILDESGLSEPYVARQITRQIPSNHGLFLGNSMPIRDMDLFGRWDSERALTIGANRGASGIDGIMASAVGFGIGFDKPVTLLFGDLSALHDLNSLAMVAKAEHPVVIVIINNDGGGIFHFLPVASETTEFEKFFGTPHGFEFKHAGAMFGVKYSKAKTCEEFQDQYRDATQGGCSAIIEVMTERESNVRLHHTIEQSLRDVAP